MEPIRIRPAAPSDLDVLCRMEVACFAQEAFPRRVLSYLITKARGTCLVALHDGRAAGYISLLLRAKTRNVRIYSVAVDPANRGCGIARKLIDEALHFAREQGRTCITLEVRCDNAAAIALYEKAGFHRTTRLHGYYHDNGDGWKMVRQVEGLREKIK